jgi:hypothetical protein
MGNAEKQIKSNETFFVKEQTCPELVYKYEVRHKKTETVPVTFLFNKFRKSTTIAFKIVPF